MIRAKPAIAAMPCMQPMTPTERRWYGGAVLVLVFALTALNVPPPVPAPPSCRADTLH